MKRILLFTLVLFPVLLFSQTQWQDDGIPLRIAQNISFGQTISCTDGNLFITWSETRNESRGVYAQKMDSDGNLLWGEDGKEIVNVSNTQRNVKVIATNDNSIIIAWKDWRDPDVPELRIQKIDADGNFLWGDEGIVLCANLYMNSNVELVPDSSNGVYIFWYIMSSGQTGTYANHILADGSFAAGWPTGGTLIFTNSIYDAVPDNAGNIVFTTVIDDELVIQKMDENGNFLWGTTGQLISNFYSYSYVGKIIPNNDNTYYVVWRDNRVSDGIYCQLIDQNGNKMWIDDTELVTENYYYRHSINTSNDDLIVCWIEENNPTQVIAQKIDNTGTKQWGVTGVVVSGDEDSHVNGMVPDNNNGCWVTWMSNKVYVQHLDSAGNKLLEANGLVVCQNDGFQFYPSINAAPNNEFFVNWIDRRGNKSGIYSQIVDNTGNLILNTEGVKIIDGISGDILELEVITNSNGIYYLWKDNRPYGHNEIFLHSIDMNGNILFQENGESIMPDFNGYVRNYEYQFNENTDLLNIVWEDSENSQLFVQAVESSGTLVWPESGVMLNSPYLYNTDPKISHIDEYTYVGWTANEDGYSPDNQVIVQKIDQNGNLLWGEEGIILNSVIGNDFINTMTGRCYFWLALDNSQYMLYAKLLDEDGNTAPGWNDDGMLISNMAGQVWFNDINVQPFDIESGFLIFWIDDQLLLGQLITEEGVALWQEGGLPIINSGHGLTNMVATFDEDQDMTYMVWMDTYPVFDTSIYAQKVDINGNELWADNGISISEGMYPDVAKIGDYILIVWNFKTEDHTYDIKAQLVNSEGEQQWEQGGITICDSPHDQLEPKVEVIDESNFVICWRDNRAGQYGENEVLCTSIYTQKIYTGPTYTPDDILNAITEKLQQNYPNPFNPTTSIEYSIQYDAKIELSIFNIKGQKVRQLVNEQLESGKHSVIWVGEDDNGKQVSSGIYYYKLIVNGKTEAVKKCLLLK